MANYSTLKAAVADVVKTNGSQAITGANLQTVLLSIINSIGGGGYIFNGIATPSTDAGTPDQNVFYIGGAGTYANFGTSVTVLPTNIAVFKYNGSWTCEQVMVENGGVFDISAFKAIGGTLATYADLSAALGTNGANIPESLRKGGMSVKFVQSSDNKYVQYRLMSDSFNTTVANWQGVDEKPTPGSDNMAKSGGILESAIREDDTLSYDKLTDFVGWNGSSEFTFTNNSFHKVIPVKSADEIKVSNYQGVTTMYIQFVKSYTQPKVGSVSYDFATGESSHSISISASGITTLSVPSDAKYMIISSIRVGVEMTPVTLTINGIDIKQRVIDHLKTIKMDLNSINVSQITSDSFDPEPMSDSVKLVKSGDIYAYDLKNQLVGNGVAPVIYQGDFSAKGVYTENNYRVTTKVFRVPADTNIRIHINKGYSATLYAGTNPDFTSVFATDLGWVINNACGGDYIYTGGNEYLCLNIAKGNKSVDISPSDVNDIGLLIGTEDALVFRNKEEEVNRLINTGYMQYWSNIPEYPMRNGSNGFMIDTANGHKVIPVKGGDVIGVSRIISSYLQFVKSYHIPTSEDTSYDFADGETTRNISINEFVVPQDAKYMIITSNNYKYLTINGYDILTGTLRQTKGNYMIVEGLSSNDHISPFTLYAGNTYRISFKAINYSGSNMLRKMGGNYLFLAFNDAYITGVDDSGNTVTLNYTSDNDEQIAPPSDCIFTPAEDGYVFVHTRFKKDTSLIITFILEKESVANIKNDSILSRNLRDMRSWFVEDMIMGGKNVGSPDFTMTYMCNHVFTKGGDCYVAGFYNDKQDATGEDSDNKGGLIHFNMANPEKTSELLVALAPGDVVFEGENKICTGVKQTVVAQIDDTTLRVMMFIGDMDVYKDYNITTKTFEQYCHRCKVDIDGTEYNLNFTDAPTIVELLNLTKYGTSESVINANLMSFQNSPTKVDEYFYEIFNMKGWSRAIFRSTDLETWEFFSEIPYPYLTDEFQLWYIYNRLYVSVTGNLGRRENGGNSAILYYNFSKSNWSQPVYFEPYYGQDVSGLAAVDGKIYVFHQKLKINHIEDGYAYDNITRADNYPDNYQVKRSIKTMFVFDQSLNLLNKFDIKFRRAYVTSHFGVYKGNLYAFVGTAPKILDGNDGRQTAMFSYIDTRFLDI